MDHLAPLCTHHNTSSKSHVYGLVFSLRLNLIVQSLRRSGRMGWDIIHEGIQRRKGGGF